MKIINAILLVWIFTSCSANTGNETNNSNPKNQKDYSYWFQGKAELNNYELKQSRYGELRDGHAVLIFVTEDFNTKLQVKADYPDKVPSEKVLKLNFTKKFNTGIYPYSTMTSVFSPLYPKTGFPKAIKISTSSQEWCGHTFMQLNRKSKGYQLQQFSYFESEADKVLEIDPNYLEDEIWNIIRLEPENLPVGEINILPSSLNIRLKHTGNNVQKAQAELIDQGEQNIYRLSYETRILEIEFDEKFPHVIRGWKEFNLDTKGNKLESLTTTARLKKQILLDYWNKNSNADSLFRKELGLDQ